MYRSIIAMSLLCCWSYAMDSLTLKELALAEPKVSFTFEDHDSCQYRLNVHTPHGILVADFCVVNGVSHDCPFYAYLQCISGRQMIDLWPVNGRCTMAIKEMFSGRVLQELGTQAKIADKIAGEQVRLFVLDLKDGASRYRDKRAIMDAENRVRDLFLAEHTRRTVKNKLNNANVLFFLREGLLKSTLVNDVLTPDQVALYDSPGSQNKPGRDAFCMLCELIMNGFKMGLAVRFKSGNKSHTLNPEDFFEYVQPPSSCPQYRPLNCVEVVKLHTLYSAYYEETYGCTNEYYQALALYFNTEHTVYENMITHISLKCLRTIGTEDNPCSQEETK